MSAKALVLVAGALLCATGCDFPGGGQRPEGVRFITGTLDAPEEDLFGRFNTGLQMAAVAIGTAEDADSIKVFASGVFDASRLESARFTAVVDDDRSAVLVLQVPSASAGGPGVLLATLTFDNGRGTDTLLPAGAADINLGTLTVAAGATPAETTLVVGDALNPLGQVDTDADGSTDLSDADDDGDDVPDATDPDVGGDGVDDAEQVLSALPDDDGDGIPDLLEG